METCDMSVNVLGAHFSSQMRESVAIGKKSNWPHWLFNPIILHTEICQFRLKNQGSKTPLRPFALFSAIAFTSFS
jgi:hypothetical protein